MDKVLQLLIQGKADWTGAIKQTQQATEKMKKNFIKAFDVPTNVSNAKLERYAKTYTQGISNAIKKYRAADTSGDVNTMDKMLQGDYSRMIRQTSNLPSLRQRLSAGFRGASSGYGKYVLGYGIGGNLGVAGISVMDQMAAFGRASGIRGFGTAGGVIGGAMLGAGALYKGGRAAMGMMEMTGGLLGLSPSKASAYSDFEKAIRVAASNLETGGEEFGKSTKILKNAAFSLSSQFGLAGNVTETAQLLKSIAGIPGLSKATDVQALAKEAMAFSMITEGTSPEQVGKGMISIQAALRGQGKNYGLNQIASAMYTAGVMSLGDVGDIAKQSRRVSEYINYAGPNSKNALAEALGIMTLESNLGYTAPMAGTQTASYKRQSTLLAGKLAKMGVVGRAQDWLGMNPLQQFGALSKAMGTEGIDKSLLQVVVGKLFGAKGGAFFSALGSTENQKMLQDFIKAMDDATTSTEKYDVAKKRAEESVGNRLANAQNTFEMLQLQAQGSFLPMVAAGLQKGTISAQLANMKAQGLEGTSEYKNLQDRLSKTESVSDVKKSIMAQYGGEGSMYKPLIDFGEYLGKIMETITPKQIETTVNGIINVFTSLGNVLMGLISVISNIPGVADKGTKDMIRIQSFGMKHGISTDFLSGMTEEQMSRLAGQISNIGQGTASPFGFNEAEYKSQQQQVINAMLELAKATKENTAVTQANTQKPYPTIFSGSDPFASPTKAT